MEENKPVIWVGRKQEYFWRGDWTGQIRLKTQENFGRARRGRNAPSSLHERSDMQDSVKT
jgi:hypothetical protein